jgi:hypothetical protein
MGSGKAEVSKYLKQALEDCETLDLNLRSFWLSSNLQEYNQRRAREGRKQYTNLHQYIYWQ